MRCIPSTSVRPLDVSCRHGRCTTPIRSRHGQISARGVAVSLRRPSNRDGRLELHDCPRGRGLRHNAIVQHEGSRDSPMHDETRRRSGFGLAARGFVRRPRRALRWPSAASHRRVSGASCSSQGRLEQPARSCAREARDAPRGLRRGMKGVMTNKEGTWLSSSTPGPAAASGKGRTKQGD
jgi:hypothetical protein